MNARDFVLNQLHKRPQSREELIGMWSLEPVRLEKAIKKLKEQGQVKEDGGILKK